jgi:hypothetical protein
VISTMKVGGAAACRPALGLELHPLAVSWYEALGEGPEAQFYTPALWQRARIVASTLSDFLRSSKPSSMMYTALQVDMKSLLVDAGELRRLHIEVQAAEPVQGGNVIDYRAAARARASAGS